ncbi:hypothetical protein BKA64DRAFT_679792 [Cadophora sp. MPI-SDFR-AT-0126]|nr:hypothetical protein BKA64DRAFT_679792 [Leotiomycetes sp. MPI-SDFR-AT-0126]
MTGSLGISYNFFALEFVRWKPSVAFLTEGGFAAVVVAVVEAGALRSEVSTFVIGDISVVVALTFGVDSVASPAGFFFT